MAQSARSRRDREAALAGDLDPALDPVVGRTELGYLQAYDLVDVHQRLQGDMAVTALGQQPVDDLRQSFDLTERDRGLFPDDRRVLRRENLLQPHRQRGERRTQLVRRVLGQLPFGREHLRDPVRTLVERTRHPVDLGQPVAVAVRTRVTGSQSLGGIGELDQRLGQSPRLPSPDRNRHQDRDHAEPDQGEAFGPAAAEVVPAEDEDGQCEHRRRHQGDHHGRHDQSAPHQQVSTTLNRARTGSRPPGSW